MGKGDKKTRRGKIIIGTFGVRRRRKKDIRVKPEVMKEVIPAGLNEKKPVRVKKTTHGSKETPEVKEVKKSASATRPAREAREGSEVRETVEETPAAETVGVKEAITPEQKTEAKAARPAKEKKETGEPKSKKDKTGKQGG